MADETHEVRDIRNAPFLWAEKEIILDYGQKIGAYGIAVYMVLACHANKEEQCWPSHGTIAKLVGLSRSTVIRTLDKLQEEGLIRITQRTAPDGTPFNSNVYTLLEFKGGVSQGNTPVSIGHTPVSEGNRGYVTETHKQDKENNIKEQYKKKRENPAPDPLTDNLVIQIYKNLTELKKDPKKAVLQKMLDTVTDNTLWEKVITGWLATGYKAENVNGMLDWYKQGKTSNAPTNGATYTKAAQPTKIDAKPLKMNW